MLKLNLQLGSKLSKIDYKHFNGNTVHFKNKYSLKVMFQIVYSCFNYRNY